MTFPLLKNKSVQEYAIVHYSAAAKVSGEIVNKNTSDHVYY